MRRKTDRKRVTRSREADRQRLEAAAEFYLRACYGTQTAARAEEFAEYLRLARPYLSRRVAELIGMPVRDFLRERQLAYAQRLLRTTPLSIEQIALASAFGTGWTFYRCFKAAFGVTPSAYRRQVTKCE
jgi:AraC-like DNA-binding protein